MDIAGVAEQVGGAPEQPDAGPLNDKLVAAIRKRDKRHMVTVGVIPWALTFPKAKPLFYSREVGENLDFVSVHFYPRKDKVDEAEKTDKVIKALDDLDKSLEKDEQIKPETKKALQDLTDEHVRSIDELLEHKEQELLEV